MRTLIFTDPHIDEKSQEELANIFAELITYKADKLVMVGDYYNKSNPSTKDILFGTCWIQCFKQCFKEIIFIRGNHDKIQDISAIDYLQYLGVKIVDEYIDEENNYFGHFMTNKSKFEYGTYYKTVKELKRYNYVILGHQHSFQFLNKEKNILHLGSCRFVNFNELDESNKYLAILEDNQLNIKTLTSVYPMIQVTSSGELITIKDNKSKVRLVISSFSQYKTEIREIEKWKNKFINLKVKLDFDNDLKPEINKTKVINLQKILNEWLETIEDKEVKKELEDELRRT